MSWLGDIFRYRDLLLMLTWRDIRIKYKQSVLGLLWAILMPAVIVLAGIIVKLAFATISGKQLAAAGIASVAIKAVPWAFFVSSIRFSTTCLTGNANLVSRIRFPKVILPISTILSQFFDFLIASSVLVILLLFIGLPVSAAILWIPVLILIVVMLATGLGIFLSAAGLFFRDVKYIVEVFLTFAVFFTPVFYDVSMFKKWGTLMLLNPVAPILEGLTAAVVDRSTPNLMWIAYSLIVSVVTLLVAGAFFRKVEFAFAECI
ncbi:MAG: ABC transporter permease [Thermoguttaceae bacterium]